MLSHEQLRDYEEGSEFLLDFKKLRTIASGKVDVVPVVVQEANTKEVLILAYVNDEALEQTLKTKVVTFYSTSRNALWVKGKTSGDFLDLIEVRINCEQNSLLFLVTSRTGGSCHTLKSDGTHRSSCYYRRLDTSHTLEHIDG